jgi:ABC-type antimicrobial peptide transport system permease subunit
VATRRNEIGIRMALGASARDVISTILRQTLLLLVCGVAIGVVLLCRRSQRWLAALRSKAP